MEKIRRDVRITTIYEGTSEIMEMTIARGRWQEHLKSRGRYYATWPPRWRTLHAAQPARRRRRRGARPRSRSPVVLDCCRAGRLTRNQHVLFRIGELVAAAETAVVFARAADRAMAGRRFEKSPTRFDGEALAAMSRVFAREVRAARSPSTAPAGSPGRWTRTAPSSPGSPASPPTPSAPPRPACVADMDRVADVLYDRTPA